MMKTIISKELVNASGNKCVAIIRESRWGGDSFVFEVINSCPIDSNIILISIYTHLSLSGYGKEYAAIKDELVGRLNKLKAFL